MRVIVQDTLKNSQWVGYDGVAGFAVGRDKDCAVCLASQFVSRKHLSVERAAGGWRLKVNESALPITCNDEEVKPGQTVDLKQVNQLRLPGFVLNVLCDEEVQDASTKEIDDINELQRDLHTQLLRRLDLRRQGQSSLQASGETLEQINHIVDELLHHEFKARIYGSGTTKRRLLETIYETRLFQLVAQDHRETLTQKVASPGMITALEEEAHASVQRLARRLGLGMTAETSEQDVRIVNEKLREGVRPIVESMPDNVLFYMIARFLKKVLCDMIFGLGPLQDLLDAPSVSEIMVVSPSLVYVERAGRVNRSNRTFLGDDALMSVIERIVAPMGRRIDRSTPLVDARLKDGSRVNAIIPPLALKGPCLTIRRFPMRRIGVDDLVKWGSMTPAAATLLAGAVKARKNMVIAGGTGSGKTTLLNVLSTFIPGDERIVTIEDAAELQLSQDHVVSLETRPPNVEGLGAYTIRDLVKNALRMRPDRIIVGECRGAEALDMLQAMNTGHSGSMTSVHANSAQDVFSRLENMVLTAADLPLAAVRNQIAQAVDLIVFQQRLKNGKRMITQVTEVLGLNPSTGEAETRDIMAADAHDLQPRLRATGYMPGFMGELVDQGLIDLDQWFSRASE
ncbi:MAG: Flp pilus assembly complex ATPase component TadA [Phycisphaerales bacterium]|nr:Flp pilus assembly complex ATPase component TadA [Phycisphaerales bacterium]